MYRVSKNLTTTAALLALSLILLPVPPALAELTVEQAIVRSANFRQHNDIETAQRALKTVEKKAKNNAGYYAERAAVDIDLNQFDRAIADCSSAIKLNPKLSDAYDRRAYCLGLKGDLNGALRDYSMVVKLNPSSPKPWYNRALTYKKLGRLQEAGRDLQMFDRLSSKLRDRADEAMVLEAAQKQVKDGRPDTAIGAIEAANKKYPMAGYAYNLAALYKDKGNTALTLKYLDQAISLATNNSEKTSTLAFALADRGALKSNQGKYKEALEDYTRLLTLCQKGHPVNSVSALLKEYTKLALGEKARAELGLKQYDKSIADCSKVIALSPRNGLAYQMRGLAYQGQGKSALAEADFKKAHSLGITAATNLATILKAPEGGYTKTYNELTAAMKANPNAIQPIKNRAFLSMQANQNKQAIEDFTLALTKDSKDAQALQGRAECYFATGEYQKAIDDFDTIIKTNPQKAKTAYSWRARCFGKINAKHDGSEPQAD